MEAPAKRGNEMFGAAILGQPKLFVDPIADIFG